MRLWNIRVPPIVWGILYWTERAILWSCIVALFSLNVYAKLHASRAISYFLPVLREPFEVQSHVQVGSLLWQRGFHEEAQHELVLATDLAPASQQSVLGAHTSPTQLLTQWKSEPKKLQETYQLWKTILTQKPDYRDAYVQAGIAAFQLGKRDEAARLLDKAHVLDPNFRVVSDLLVSLQRVGN